MKRGIIALFSIMSLVLVVTSCSNDDDNSNTQTTTRNLEQEEANKVLVTDFYQRLFGNKDVTAIDDYIAEDLIQHNPQVADGKQALLDMANMWLAGAPETTVDFRKTMAEDDIVVLHVKSPTPDGSFQAIAEFFRVEDGMIVEHWDVTQAAPATSANDHPLF